MQPIALSREREEAALHRKGSDVNAQQAVGKAPGCEARTFRCSCSSEHEKRARLPHRHIL